MSTYQAFMSAGNSPNDSLSLIQNGSNLVATVSNVAPILQPIRIITNGLSATSALTRIVTDWKDPNKKVQPGDVLTLMNATGTIVVTLLVWAEIGPGAAAAIGALALAADLQSSFQPYVSSAKIWLGATLSKTMQLSSPVSPASASLYWGGMPDGSGWNLYSYDELMSGKGLFACMTDDMVSGTIFRIKGSPVPGSFTPVNESQYKTDRCQYDYVQLNGRDESSWMTYCQSTMYR
ncbi:hypothetical protein [Paraburkholderia dipogonis]|uniref:hypothetical protein n=1 Tax=Paraburkholderia dipogonis TaxID=1211383 RepID=UPI0038BBDD61